MMKAGEKYVIRMYMSKKIKYPECVLNLEHPDAYDMDSSIICNYVTLVPAKF